MGVGGVLDSVKLLSGGYFVVWTWETIMYCAVNCYAIISGFVCFGREAKWRNVINLWVQTFFYSAGITAVLFLAGELDGESLREIFKSVLPMSTNRYWYFSSYVGMFAFIPLLNKLVETMERDNLRNALIIIVCVLSLPTTIFYSDPFVLEYGCSVLWLMIMYLIGAYLKKYENDKLSQKTYAAGFLLATLGTSVLKYVIVFLTSKVGIALPGSFLDTNVTPTIVIAAICLFCLFKNIKISSEKIGKIIVYIGSLSYGIFLVHFHPFIVSHYLKNSFAFLGEAIIERMSFSLKTKLPSAI
jgi:surface polysaccharide O-acyltransferase-like enzyme